MNASTTCTATYNVTQDDVNVGQITNTAHAQGYAPAAEDATESNEDNAVVTVPQGAELSLVKSVSPDTVNTAGDSVTYSFLVTNTGNVTVYNLSISEDSFSGTGTLSAIDCPVTTLAPNDSTTCAATYSVTQDDINAGSITNIATAHGDDPTGNNVDSNPDHATVNANQNAALTLVKSANPTTVSAQGDSVTYSFLVTNTGNLTISDLTIPEDSFSGTGTMSAVSCPTTTLAPNASTTCTATYSVTQDDINAGQITNTAHAHGSKPDGATTDSNTDDAVVTATQTTGLTLVKSASPTTVNAAGDSVTYSFLVTNTGNVTVSGLMISEDSFSGTGTVSAISCPDTTLAPNASTTCTATYSVTQADADAGVVTNTATAHGLDPSDNPVDSNQDNAQVDIPAAPALSLVKSANPTTVSAQGDLVTYSFLVTNTGNVTISNVGITEDSVSGTAPLSAVFCSGNTLAPGDSTTCTATYNVTQDDIIVGQITNAATAHGTGPDTMNVDSNQDDAVVTADQNASLTLVKSASPTIVSAAGDSVTYSFEVTNNGNLPINNLMISEDSFSGTGAMSAISCPVTTLEPTDSTTCTATYSVTQADVDAGVITNTATAHGTDPSENPVDSNQDQAVVDAPAAPALSLVKSASPTTVNADGDSVSYSFDVTNTGNVTLSNVNISDDVFSGTGTLSAITCPATTLAPGASTTCTATYSVTQADIDAGQVTNTATAHGTPPHTQVPVDSQPSDAIVTAPATPGLTLVKSANPATVNAAGDSVAYSFEVTNNGNVTVNGLWISEDAFSGTGTLSTIVCPATTLAPNASTTCTATYAVTQADVDAGIVTNTATAHGTDPSESPVTSNQDDAEVEIPAAPELNLVKSADPITVAAEGDLVTYSFDVTNTGNVTIKNLGLTEDSFSGTGTMSAISCPATTLAPGASTTCTATYNATQDDIDAGQITNAATAHGTGPDTMNVDSNQDDAVVTADQNAALTLVKSVDPATAHREGDEVTYSFEVTNNGNLTIDNLSISEDSFSGTGSLSAITCPVTTLAPSASTTCTATYMVSQPDVDAGWVTNTATAHGTNPAGDTVDSNQDDAELTIPADPSLSLVKSADPTTVHSEGDSVTYSFDVTNTGNVTISYLNISEDAFSGTGTLSAIDCPTTTLDPNHSTTCTATYSVTQADIDAGQVTNTASAHGLPPHSETSVDSPPSDAIVDAPAAPSLSLVKTADPTTVHAAGDLVTYSFLVTNTGNVTVNDVSVSEDAFSGTDTTSIVDCPLTTLAPGESTTCTAIYHVTQGDVDAGTLTNTATAHGFDPSQHSVDSNPDDAVVDIPADPSLSLVKTVDPTTVHEIGDPVTYSFSVTNTGNVTISNLTVSEDAFSGTGTMSAIICPATTLAPGATTACSATYQVTAADVDAGQVTNTATAHGTPPGSEVPVDSPPSDAIVDIPSSPGLELIKTADPTTVHNVGDTINYSFAVTNTGNVTISNLTIAEDSFSGTGTMSAITCPETTLASGASTTCTATYKVTQADVDAGQVTNSATAHGTPPNPEDPPVVSPPSETTVDIPAAPALSLVKSANPATVSNVGDTVTYGFAVTNTGNVTIDNLTISEDAFSGTGTMSAITCPVTTLASGASTTCTATYQVTQADVDAGQVTNTASAHGTPPGSEVPVDSPPSDSVVDIPAAPALSLVKSASPATVHAAGDTVTYSFAVTNTGNVTVSNLTISDDAFSGTGTLSAITCPVTTLASGASTTCTATYTATQADIDAGQVTNTATAHGTPPNPEDPPVASPPSHAVVDAPADPALSLVKTADPTTVHTAGDTVTYSFAVTNTGNVTIKNLTIAEDSFSGTGTISATNCPVTTLAPGASTTCTATYQVTQADVDAGQVTNTATAHGTPPNPEDPPVVSPPSDSVVDIPSAPALSLVKTADPTTVHDVGSTVTYSFAVTNTGNVTISNLTMAEDSFSGTGTMSAITCPVTTLAPAATTTCTATYQVTQADVDAGQVTNTATAHGTPPNPEDPPVASPPSSSTVTIPADPSLSLVKTADPTEAHEVGDTITYSFAVTNTGNVTIDNLTISEDAFSGTGTLSTIACPVATLASGDSTTCTATYTLTQADVDAGQVTNTATAHGTPPNPEDPPVVSPPSDSTVDIPAAPALDLVKTADPAKISTVGQVVTYSFKVTNTGNVTIKDLTISEDAFSGTGSLSKIVCPVTTLAAGESTTCTATYKVTVKDASAGTLTNKASAHGKTPGEASTSVSSRFSTAVITLSIPAPPVTPQPNSNPTSTALPTTGFGLIGYLSLAGILALMGAGAVLIERRRRLS